MHDSDILDSDSDMHAPPHAYGMLQPWLNRLSIYRQRGITGKIPDANFPVQPHSFEHGNPEGIQRYHMSAVSRLFLVLVMLRLFRLRLVFTSTSSPLSFVKGLQMFLTVV